MFFFQKSREKIGALFVKNQIPTVFELFIHELSKFVLRSLSSMHAEPYLNNFSYAHTSRNLRHSNESHHVVPMVSSRSQNYSLKNRGAKLFNLLVSNRIIAGQISLNLNQFKNLAHQLKELYILRNSELVNYIFDC